MEMNIPEIIAELRDEMALLLKWDLPQPKPEPEDDPPATLDEMRYAV